jgi:hypothetical protein
MKVAYVGHFHGTQALEVSQTRHTYTPAGEFATVEVISAVPTPSFNPTAMGRLEGSPVIRSPEQLRLHRAVDELGWVDLIGEPNEVAQLTNPYGVCYLAWPGRLDSDLSAAPQNCPHLGAWGRDRFFCTTGELPIC